MNILYEMKRGTEHLNYGRQIITEYCERCIHSESQNVVRVLDLGAGTGTDLLNCKKHAEGVADLELWALEKYQPNVEKLKAGGIKVKSINIENEVFPFEDRCMDFVIMNQILEHTKEVFWIFGEVSRILKWGGALHSRCPEPGIIS